MEKKYSLVKEDDRAFHVRHADGSVFQVAKNSISPQTAKMIQKFADGGDVEPVEAEPSQVPASLDPNPVPSLTTFDPNGGFPEANYTPEAPAGIDSAMGIGAIGNINPSHVASKAGGLLQQAAFPGMAGSQSLPPEPPSAAAGPMDAQKQAMQNLMQQGQTASDHAPTLPGMDGMQNPMAQMLGGYDKMEKAYANAFAAQDRIAKQTAGVIGDVRKQLAEQDNVYNASMERYRAQDEQLYQQLQSKEIDPNHFYSTRGTGQKLAIGLGMALAAAGGAGADATNMLNRAIDRDIESQKMGLGKIENQLALNMRREGNLTQAMQITKAQMLTGMELQAKQIASANGSPQAMLQYQNAVMQIHQMKMQLFQNAAMMSVEHQLSGQGMSQLPPVVTQSKDLRERIVRDPQTGGKYFAASTPEDAKELKTMFAAYTPLMDTIQTLKKIGNATNPSDYNRAHSAIKSLPIQLNEFANISRLSAEDIHQMEAMVGDPTSWFKPGKEAATNQLIHFIDGKMESNKRGRIPGYQGGASNIQFSPVSYKGK